MLIGFIILASKSRAYAHLRRNDAQALDAGSNDILVSMPIMGRNSRLYMIVVPPLLACSVEGRQICEIALEGNIPLGWSHHRST